MTTNGSWRQSPHALIASIGRAAALEDAFGIPVRQPGHDNWIGAESVLRHDAEGLRALVAGYGRDRLETENRHLAGSGFIIAFLTRLTFPLISQYVLERRVLDVSLSNLAFHTSGGRIDGTALSHPRFAVLPNDPDFEHPDALVVRDDKALYEQLKQWLFESNFELVIPSLHQEARASRKVSWNAVAASCAQVFYHLYDLVEKPETVIRHAETFFEDEISPIYRQVSMEVIEHLGKQGYFARRAGCCLYWRVRDSNIFCSGCVLLKEHEQTEQFQRLLARRP